MEIAARLRKSYIYPKCLLFLSFQVLHDITMLFTWYLHILHHLQAMKMIVISNLNVQRLKFDKIIDKFVGKSLKIELGGVCKVFFS